MTSLYGSWVLTPRYEPGESPRCSARGCRAAASVDLSWRNPKLHDAAREKHWLACDEHADGLADFLARRDFLLRREPLVG